MVRVSVMHVDGGYRWALTRFTSYGADVLARGLSEYSDEDSCRTAARCLATVSPATILAIQQADGRWRWRLSGDDGEVLAESAETYGDAASCGHAIVEIQRELRALPV